MSAPTLQTTSLLTEHLQYPPIALVDDIINAVNEIMYKCTSAMEKYLLEKSTIDGTDYTSDIKIGVAKLETLLEHSVDKNFDKLELYVLRNILRVPQELLDSNSFRLKHQQDIVLANKQQIEDGKKILKDKVKQIEDAFELNSQLQKRIEKTEALYNKVEKFKKLVIPVLQCDDSEVTKEYLRSLQPLDDSIKLLTTKLRQMYIESEEKTSMEEIQSVIQSITEPSNVNCDLSSRSKYVESRTIAIMGQNTLEVKADNTQDYKINSNSLNNLNIQKPDLSALNEELN